MTFGINSSSRRAVMTGIADQPGGPPGANATHADSLSFSRSVPPFKSRKVFQALIDVLAALVILLFFAGWLVPFLIAFLLVWQG